MLGLIVQIGFIAIFILWFLDKSSKLVVDEKLEKKNKYTMGVSISEMEEFIEVTDKKEVKDKFKKYIFYRKAFYVLILLIFLLLFLRILKLI